LNIDFTMRVHQMEVYKELNRFNVLLAHRRFGKTVFSIMVLVLWSLQCKKKKPQHHYFAPTYSQAKRVAWNYLKEYTMDLGAIYNESELKATLPHNGIIQLGSADNPDSTRGIYSDGVVLDEPANMPSRMWTEVLRPALSDRKGSAIMIGTPAGRHGLFYDSYQEAEAQDDWWRGMYKASETGIVDEEELAAARKVMSKAEYAQEFECSWDAAIKGAYYAETMNKLEGKGQLCPLVHDSGKKVHCAFDLGFNDSTAIWWFQINGDVVNLINYDEVSNMGIPDIVKEIQKLDYNYGAMIFPHDVEVHGLSTGKTRKHTLEALGIEVVVAPKAADVITDIETTRLFLERCRFDVSACKDGIETLRHYRSEWSQKNNVLQLRPLHDWSSHGADAFRYLATTDLSRLTHSGWDEDIVYSHEVQRAM